MTSQAKSVTIIALKDVAFVAGDRRLSDRQTIQVLKVAFIGSRPGVSLYPVVGYLPMAFKNKQKIILEPNGLVYCLCLRIHHSDSFSFAYLVRLVFTETLYLGSSITQCS